MQAQTSSAGGSSPTRRQWIFLGATSVTAALGAGLAVWRARKHQENHFGTHEENLFGTLGAPRYGIRNPEVVKNCATFGAYLSSCREALSNRRDSIEARAEAAEERIKAVEQTVKQVTKIPKAARTETDNSEFAFAKLSLNGVLLKLLASDLLMARDVALSYGIASLNGIRGINQDSSTFEKEFGPSDQLARAVFEKLTGTPLPGEVKVHADVRNEDFSAIVDETTRQVRIAEKGYVVQLLGALHEFGHLITLHSDHARSARYTGAVLSHSLLLDEAGAYLFEGSAAHSTIPDPLGTSMRLVHRSNMHELTRRHLNGDTEVHAHAGAIGDALIELSDNNPARAYQTLTELRMVPIEVREIIDRNRQGFSKLSGDILFKRVLTAADKVYALFDKMS